MAKIKLFSGMDFSGKSTIIKIIDAAMPGVFKCQKKFLTSIDTIEKLRGVWLPAEIWKPLLQENIREDIANYLQDDLWIIKYIATKLEMNSPEDYEELEQLQQLLWRYPDMDSFYLTTPIEERIRRFGARESSGGKITGSDKKLLSAEVFERTENHYKNIILSRFPNTRIIDTISATPEQTAKDIMQDKDFLRDL
jgi:thymidylate kinase